MSVIYLYFLDVLPSSRIYLTKSKFHQQLIVIAIHLDILPSSRIYLVIQSKFCQLLIVLAIHFINTPISIACIINLRCMGRIFIAKNFELSNYSFHWINFDNFRSPIIINIFQNYHLHTMDFTFLDGRLTTYEDFRFFNLDLLI